MQENEAQKQGQMRLEQRLAPFRLRVNQDTDAEGDCQFDATADQLAAVGRPRLSKEQVREQTIAWLRGNPNYRLSDEPDNLDTLASWVRDTQGIAWDTYLEGMSRSKVWGDEITLKGIVEAFNVRIMLLSSTVDPDNYYSLHRPAGDDSKAPTLWLCHFLEVHYGSLLPELEWTRREEAKRIRLAEMLQNLPPSQQVDALTDVVTLDNKSSLDRIQVISILQKNSNRVDETLRALRELIGGDLRVPLHRVCRYGPLEPAEKDETGQLRAELARASVLVKSLGEENKLLRQNQSSIVENDCLEWDSMVAEDGCRWLRVRYQLSGASSGEMLTLQRVARFNNSAKMLSRRPLPSAEKGAVLFEWPSAIGHYQVEHSCKGEIKCRSEIFLPRPLVQLSLAGRQEEKLLVHWTMIDASLASTSDWIALYRPNEVALSNYVAYAHVKPSTNIISLNLSVAEENKLGAFVIRYFSGDNRWYPVCELSSTDI